MDNLNLDNEDNKVYETEPGVGKETAEFSSQAQKDKFLGGSLGNNNGQEQEKLNLTEKSLSFFGKLTERHTGVTALSVGVLPATIGQFLINGPEIGIITAGLFVGAAAVLEKADRNSAKYAERMAQRRNQTTDRAQEISDITKTR